MREPLEKGYITQSYKTNHRAYDIGWVSVQKGTPYLLAVDDGVVAVAGFSNGTGAGNFIGLYIESGNPNFKYLVTYAHNKENLVKTGQKVKKGERIAIGGSTGKSTGPHVHFEVWKVPKNYKYTGYNFAKDRNIYAIPPNQLINFQNITKNSAVTLYGYKETLLKDMKATTTSKVLNMRDYPSTYALSAGFMPSELKAIAKTTKIHGHEWIKCEYKGRNVYVASQYVKLVSANEPIIIEKEVIVEKIIEVEKPFKEVFERNGIMVTVERK